MSDLNVKVVLRNTHRALDARRINVVPNGPREIEAWDGDQQLVLSRNGPSDQNLNHRLEELRKRPQLAAMAVPVARSVQDTLILWSAWKNSMLDTLGQLFEHRLFFHLQQLCDQDETAARHRVRDLAEQLNTTMASWRSQVKFLNDERVQLVAVYTERVGKEKTALLDLENQGNASPIYRVLRNAVKAVDNTNIERLQLWQKKAQLDHNIHLQTMHGVFQGLDFCVQNFNKDCRMLKQQAQAAQRDVDNSIQTKQATWAQVCQQQYNEYWRGLHNPLTKLIQEIDPTAPASALLQETLNNENDPHCLRRCEVALALMRQAQAKLIGGGVATSAYALDLDADDILQHAEQERSVSEQREQQKYMERWLALQSEHAQRERAVHAAQARMQQLQELGRQIQGNLQQTFQDPGLDQKKLAVASRLAEQKLAQLREDMQQTSEAIKTEQRLLEAMRTNLSAQDRMSIVQIVLEATHRVYQICRTMRSRFESATQAENMLRQMLHEQYLKSVRELHHICQDTIQRMVQVAQSRFAQAQVQLDRLQDAYNEAGRRIDTLHRGRIEQEERSTGDDIGMYRAIEEYADTLTQRHAAHDAVQKADFIRGTAEAAINLIQSIHANVDAMVYVQ
jgi:hypothetical protein